MTAGPTPEAPRRGFFVNVGSLVSARAVLALSQILVLPIIARALTVEEFALMAMAMTVVVFCSVLSDAGLGRSLIRSPGYDLTEWSSVFWLLTGVGIALMLLILAIAPGWAAFYGETDLIPVLAALSVVPLFLALSAAPNAEIERRENYTGIASVQMATTVISLSLAVLLALAGAGVWALVAQQIAIAVIRLAGILWLTEFRPRLTFSARLLKPHLIFAKDALLISAISTVRAQVAVVAVGKGLGQSPLGLYSMSERFARVPQLGLAGPMSTVVYVRMAKAQDKPDRLVAIYLASLRLLSVALIPPLALLAVAGEAVFTILLSADWTPVATIFALSIPGLAIEAISVVCLACLFRATARTDLLVRLTIEATLLKSVLVVAAAAISLNAVALSLTIWGLLIAPRAWALAARIVPLRMADCLRTLAVPTAIGAAFAGLHIWIAGSSGIGYPAELALSAALAAAALGTTALVERRKIRAAIAVFQS
ncbi:oligosaccharide flippase family protein [Aestuariibius insulae]|uniref:oligosaccharide flippase family protein n=1 Tax=Aestuariibius insulae TaxID=2058287 RepID=UPI00345EBBF0